MPGTRHSADKANPDLLNCPKCRKNDVPSPSAAWAFSRSCSQSGIATTAGDGRRGTLPGCRHSRMCPRLQPRTRKSTELPGGPTPPPSTPPRPLWEPGVWMLSHITASSRGHCTRHHSPEGGTAVSLPRALWNSKTPRSAQPMSHTPDQPRRTSSPDLTLNDASQKGKGRKAPTFFFLVITLSRSQSPL